MTPAPASPGPRSVILLDAAHGGDDAGAHIDDAAEKDVAKSFSILPNAAAAEQLGELAEMNHQNQKAIDEYILAFVLPDPASTAKVDRRALRQKLGNVYKQVHGSEACLGEAILEGKVRGRVVVDVNS